MSMFGGNNQQRPRKFEYDPFYYDPEKEQEHHLNFRRLRQSKLPRKANNVRLLVAVIVLITIIIYLQKMEKNPDLNHPDTITVEDVIIVD